jgi:tRNA nucleotidyltransferase (CCA-adding enzyme)
MSSSTLNTPPEVLEVTRRLQRQGALAFVVGGAIRDRRLGREIRDWDVATSADPSLVSMLFERVIPTGIRHGTVTVHLGLQSVEVSVFRGSSLREDLAHRDFTIDAMAYDPAEGRIIDLFGGLRDLESRLLRAVGEPEERFQEDPLRTVRAIRMASELGFRIQTRTLRAIAPHARGLRRIALERVRDEMVRLLLVASPSRPLELMRRTGLLAEVLPELLEGYRKRQGPPWGRYTILKHAIQTVDHLPPRSALRWAGLLHDVAKPRTRRRIVGRWEYPGHEEMSARMAEVILSRLRFSRKEIHSVAHMIRHHDVPDHPGVIVADARRFVLRVGTEWANELLLLRRADRLASGPHVADLRGWRELRSRVRRVIREGDQRLRPVLTGKDVMKILGISQGHRVGEILRDMQDWVIRRPSRNRPEILARWLKERQTGEGASPSLPGSCEG